MRVVTVSREYGSGGGEVAARLARRLSWQLVDHEVVVRIARELDCSEEEAEARDERSEGLVGQILSVMPLVEPAGFVESLGIPGSAAHDYQEAVRHVVEAAAATGRVVIVGRGAQFLLADRRDALHVRVVAPVDLRIAYVAHREALDVLAARRRIEQKDRDRMRYTQSVHHHHPSEAHLYDLTINTGILDLDAAVDLACLALQRKGERLGLPAAELGPAAGLPRYPAKPGDFTAMR
ncbi:MAG TPA: cytidylate kinase-like family protein [Ktedonobacterales bacterium]|jgi:cytidylate kinase